MVVEHEIKAMSKIMPRTYAIEKKLDSLSNELQELKKHVDTCSK